MSSYNPTNPRFQRLAASTEGQTLWQLLNENDNVIRLMVAADLGHPAVEGVDELIAKSSLGSALTGSTKEAHALRQLAGMMTRDVLEAQGYRIGPNTRTRFGRVFKSGATYFKGARLQEHTCGQVLELHHHPMGNGQVLIYYTPLGNPTHKLGVVDTCPQCGERFDRRSLTDVDDMVSE